MKILPVILCFAALILSACSARKRQEPAILQEKKIDVSSIYKKRGADLIEALYEELVSNSDELKQLEKEIKEVKASWPDSLEAYNAYHEKNARYYEAAEKKASAITDSLLRKSVLNILKKSNARYRDSIAPLAQLDTLIKQRAAAIENLHSLLKILSTLPVIEEFQRSNLPTDTTADALIRRMDELIVKLDSLTQQLKPQPPTVTPGEKK